LQLNFKKISNLFQLFDARLHLCYKGNYFISIGNEKFQLFLSAFCRIGYRCNLLVKIRIKSSYPKKKSIYFCI